MIRPSNSGKNGLIVLGLSMFVAAIGATPLLIKKLRQDQGKGALFSQVRQLQLWSVRLTTVKSSHPAHPISFDYPSCAQTHLLTHKHWRPAADLYRKKA